MRPSRAFAELAAAVPDATQVFFKRVLRLALAPPAFAFIGGELFGWRLGAAQPLRLSTDALALVGIAYFLALTAGFVAAAAASRWMAVTYGAREAFGVHLALIALVGSPLALASAFHLFPHVFINVLALLAALLWSLYLLYRGLPVALGTGPERGMLMASALVGCALVGAVTLLGVTVVLWSSGVGPVIGV